MHDNDNHAAAVAGTHLVQERLQGRLQAVAGIANADADADADAGGSAEGRWGRRGDAGAVEPSAYSSSVTIFFFLSDFNRPVRR